ncbi:MAG: DNA polymerase III subunit gamma/tau [Vicinamibacterales bacterium]
MSYQVLARRWRPQRFDEVVGQEAVTRTLRNAISSGRIAQSFIFAGSRGCGKTTTARILARALNCERGPADEPCGTCDACVEIAEGRDIDVLEIDAASNTSIDDVREVIISGLSIVPVRNRYKVFIIDEVHRLSRNAFDALLKSVEEPPAHIVFMMATTELDKIPDTILSRSQVFEFKSISSTNIARQLRKMATADGLEVSDAALALIARSAEGSMRDAQSALDQVMAFAGTTISVDDVSTVLGIVGRDLLFDLIEAVVAEDGPSAFALADAAVQSGHDLKLVCRELSRVVRDLMMLSVDLGRAGDGELAEGEIERLTALSARFSREDLMRAFDLLAKAEYDIRTASQPRYQFEMVLLRWMHMRKLVPLAELMEQMSGGAVPASRTVAPAKSPAAPARGSAAPTPGRTVPTSVLAAASAKATVDKPTSAKAAGEKPAGSLKDALLAEIKRGKQLLYELHVAQASRIDVTDAQVTFTFAANQTVARDTLDQNRAWIEAAAERIAGRRITVVVVHDAGARPADTPLPQESRKGAAPPVAPTRDLKAEALSSPTVQAVLDVFPAEIRDVEEL